MLGKKLNSKTDEPFVRVGLALWLAQGLFLASGALLLMFCDAGWVNVLEQQRAVSYFMANPVEMVIVEAFGTLCILLGIAGVRDSDGFSLDAVWAGYMPVLAT